MARRASRSPGGIYDELFEALDDVVKRIEIVEAIIGREAGKKCDCISRGWTYMVMEAIEEVHSATARLKKLIEDYCSSPAPRGS